MFIACNMNIDSFSKDSYVIWQMDKINNNLKKWLNRKKLLEENKKIMNDLFSMFIEKIFPWDFSYTSHNKMLETKLNKIKMSEWGVLDEFDKVEQLSDLFVYKNTFPYTTNAFFVHTSQAIQTIWWLITYGYKTNNMRFVQTYLFPDLITEEHILVEQPYRNFSNYARSALWITFFILLMTWKGVRRIIKDYMNGHGNYLLDFLHSINLWVDAIFVMYILLVFVIAYFYVDYSNRRQKVDLDNPVFQKQYHVIATDNIEARKLLTHVLMERIMKFANKHGEDRKYEFYFQNSEMKITYDFLKSKKKHNIFNAYKKGVSSDLFIDLYYELENMKVAHKEILWYMFNKIK